LSEVTDNPKAGVLSSCLSEATVKLLMSEKSPKRKVGELDNRGSHFYLALYWAQELANQSEDAELKAAFEGIANELAVNETKIVDELNAVQGNAVDLKGYYNSPEATLYEVMRPSETFKTIIDK